MDTVRRLAGDIGPREATTASFRRAADMVAQRLRGLGYDVRRQRLSVPAGESWGIPVPAGGTANVVAALAGFDATSPHVVVGAHLDTVPQAPGAEDNASGVAVLLELARLSAGVRLPTPVVFVAFAAEEPRGPGDDDHHFGSQAYVAAMGPAERDALVGMVSLDRVGVGREVPVCTGGLTPLTIATALLRTAQRAGIAARPCENRTSDHWSFEKAGLRAARLGGTDYAEYHSSRDVPSVVSAAQLDRVGRLLWAQLRSGFPR